MNDKNFGYLGTTFQQSLLKTIIEDRKFATSIIDVIDSKYFDGPYFKYLMENIKELYASYGSVPTYDTLHQKILHENNETTSKINVDTLEAIKEKELEDSSYVKRVSLNFCRQQVLKRALKESEEIMINGDFEEYDKIEGKIQKALQVGVVHDEVEDIGDNVRESLQDDYRKPYPTGIPGIDELLKGGIAKGEMAILLAPTGIGKTTWLTMMANAAYVDGANVLHIFFEDNIKDVRRKHITMWTDIAPDNLPEHKDEVCEFVQNRVDNTPNFLKLAKYPSGDLSINEIKNKIRKMTSEGLKIDLLVLDYVDCISSEGTMTGDEWKGEGAIMRSLEGMTDEFDIAIWTATQGNRDSISSEVVTTDQMGGSIKKAQIGHVVMSIGKTLEQKENKLATLTLLKSRIGPDGIVFSNCEFDNEYLRVDTATQNTLLGHKVEKAEEKESHRVEVYQKWKEKRSETVEQLKEEEAVLKNSIQDLRKHSTFENADVVSETVNEPVSEIVEKPLTDHERASRAFKAMRDKQLVTAN